MFPNTEFPTTELEFTSAMAYELTRGVANAIERQCIAGALSSEVLSLKQIQDLYTLRATMQQMALSVENGWYFEVSGQDQVVLNDGTKFYRVPGTFRSTAKKPR